MPNTNRLAVLLLALVTALAVSVRTASARPAEGDTSISNRGFEKEGLGIFADGAARGTLSRDSTQAHSGTSSLQHVATEMNSHTRPWFGSHPVPLGHQDETLRFSAWVKADMPDTRVRMFIFCLDASGATSKEYWSASYFKASNNWTKVSHTHTCPATSASATVRLDNRDAGHTVWWDDLDLVRVENSVPDPGFESGEPQAPFAKARRGNVAIDAERAHKGLYSLRHTVETQNSFTFPYRNQGAAVLTPARAPRSYTFSAWAFADVDVPVQLSLFCLDENLGAAAHGGSQGSFTAGNKWQQLEHSHTCPEGTRYVSARLDNDGEPGSTVWWDDLILEATSELEVLDEGPGFRLIDGAPGARSDVGTQLWEVNRAGIENLPVSEAEKEWLRQTFAEDPTIGPADVLYVSKELLEGIVRPEFPAGYERYMEPGAPRYTRGICSWDDERWDGAWDIDETLFDRTWEFGAGIVDGEFRLNIPMTGNVDVTVDYRVKRCLGFLPIALRFVEARAQGEVTVTGDGDLEVTAGRDFPPREWEWDIAEPRLGGFTVWVGVVPLVFEFTLPISAGVRLEAGFEARLEAGLDASATGTFNYICTRHECTGSTDFSDEFEFTGPHASLEVDATARAWARVVLRVSLWNPGIAFVEGGVAPYAEARLWGYYGNTCGDANGDGHNETVKALTADLVWGYQFAWGVGFIGFGDDGFFGGREYSLGLLDLLGEGESTALNPMLLGPSTIPARQDAIYTVSMRPCYPFTDPVNFVMSPGTWTGDTVIPSPPGGTATVSRQFYDAGQQVVRVTATRDTFGRNLRTTFRRVLDVTVADPAAPTNLSAGALSPTTVRLNWVDKSDDEASFEIQRAPSPGVWAYRGTVSANTTVFMDDRVEGGKTYRYRVRALRDGTPSRFSNVATVTMPDAPSAPAPPSGLTGEEDPARAVRLSWTDNSNDEQGFQVQFSYSGSPWADLSPSTVGPNVTTRQIGPEVPIGTYQFRVRSFRDGLYSAWSNEAFVLVDGDQPPVTASIAWIKPAEDAWGPAGTLTAAGYAANGTGRVQLVWRERSSSGTWGPWTATTFQALPADNTTWSNTISSGNPTNVCNWFDAYVNYSGVTSEVFHYTGAPGCQ